MSNQSEAAWEDQKLNEHLADRYEEEPEEEREEKEAYPYPLRPRRSAFVHRGEGDY